MHSDDPIIRKKAGEWIHCFPLLLPVTIITGDFFKIISEDEG